MGRKRIAVEPAETLERAYKFFKARSGTIVKKGKELATLSNVDVVVYVRGFGQSLEFMTENARENLGERWDTMKQELQAQSPVERSKYWKPWDENSQISSTPSERSTTVEPQDIYQQYLDLNPGNSFHSENHITPPPFDMSFGIDPSCLPLFDYSTPLEDFPSSPPQHLPSKVITPQQPDYEYDDFALRKAACLRQLDIMETWQKYCKTM